MDLQTLSAIASPLSNVLLGLIFAIGYYISFKLYRQSISEMQESRLSGGRPQVIVQADYKRLPEVELVVRNVANGAAKDIEFEFSNAIESSDGYVVSDLRYFREGLDFMEPGGEIKCHWDSLEDLLPVLKQRDLEDGVIVTVSYKSLAGTKYTDTWRINPLLFEGYRDSSYKGMEELVETVEEIQRDLRELIGDRKEDETKTF